jgi:hypothetical protein
MRQKTPSIALKVRKKVGSLWLRLNDAIDLRKSRFLDIQDIESVCLTLGPYRNLTTLTASVLFLHPNCQVLNHAGRRIFGKGEIDFLGDYSKDKLDRFIQFALVISQKGERGNQGGSIVYSHAFEGKNKLKRIYKQSEPPTAKKDIRCLFWKESLRTSNLIRKRRVDLDSILSEEERLRFLLPIRHPLDCAASNLKTGHVAVFKGLDKDATIFEATQAVLDEIFWFAALREKFPNRFFCFFEHEISRAMLVRLAEFLQLDPDETWVANALAAMDIKPGYDHDSSLVRFYRDYVTDKKARFPQLTAGLLAFVE